MAIKNGDEAYFKCACGAEWKGIFLKDNVRCPKCGSKNGQIGATEVKE